MLAANRSVLIEAAITAVLLSGAGIGLIAGWRAYNAHVLPYVRTVPSVTPTPYVDPEVLREQARRLREVNDLVGAGIYHRQAGARELAVEHFARALAIDPQNSDALQNLREMGVDPRVLSAPPSPTPTPRP